MKYSTARAAAIAATVLAAGVVAVGPAEAATPQTTVTPMCSAAARISATDLTAGIAKAAAQETPGAQLSTRTSGIAPSQPVGTEVAGPSAIAPACSVSAAVRISAADLRAGILKAAAHDAPGAALATGPAGAPAVSAALATRPAGRV